MPEDQISLLPPTALCDVCCRSYGDTFYDCRTRIGSWGFLCIPCFDRHGVGLGEGLGQEYRKTSNGRFLRSPYTAPRVSPSLPPVLDFAPSPGPFPAFADCFKIALTSVLLALGTVALLIGLPLVLG